MTIKNDLSSLKVGDKVFSLALGQVEIKEIDYSERFYPINASNIWYTICGRATKDDLYPSLFLSAKHASEYFASIKEKKPIHVKYYVHDYLDSEGRECTFSYDKAEVRNILSTLCIKGYTYLGYTEINKTYEIEE